MLRTLALVVALALLASVPLAAAASQVKVLGGFFDPGSVDVLVGEEVSWLSEDAMPHTVTSSWDEGATFDATVRQDETFSHAFTEVGTYTVHCKPHAYYDEEAGEWTGMVMQVNVAAVEPGAGIGGPLKDTPGFGAGATLAAFALVGLALVTIRRRGRREG